ncbi:MAG: phosphatase PAP2 family protein [bacterium]
MKNSVKNKIIILSFLILAFLAITLLVVNKNVFIIGLDNTIKTFIENHQLPSISNLMLSITKIGNLYEVSAIFLIFGLFLILKNKKYFYIFTIATSLGALLPWAIKLLTQIERPSLLLEQDFSFPSSHATIATVFLFSSIFLLTPIMKKGFSKNVFTLVTFVIFPIVAFSRIYLSVHWTSDVIAGIILGSICFLSAKMICCYKKENVL